MEKPLFVSLSICFVLMVAYGVTYRSFQAKIRRTVAGFYAGKPPVPDWFPRQERFNNYAKNLTLKNGPVGKFEIEVVGLSPGLNVWAAVVHVERNGVLYEETVQGMPELFGLSSVPLKPKEGRAP